jgi:hypothetical protein
VTGRIQNVDDYTDEQRKRVAAAVEKARLDRGWAKEEAARHARISSITWKRVEDGLRVQTTKLRAVEVALGWGGGSMDRVARGRPVVIEDHDTIEQIRERGWADHSDDAIWEGFQAVSQYARDCGARGANPQLVKDFIGDAVALLNEVGRVRRHPEHSSLLSEAPDTTDLATAADEHGDWAGEQESTNEP